MTKTQIRGISAAVLALILLAGGFAWRAWSTPTHYDRVHFTGFHSDDRHQRAAIGDLVVAVRSRNAAKILELDQGPEHYERPETVKSGARWLVEHYGTRFNRPVRVTFEEALSTATGLQACIAPQGSTRGLYVMGDRRSASGDFTTSGPFKLSIGMYGSPDDLREPDFCKGWS